MNIVLMGPPGSGKGTQAELLEEKLEIPHISTGDMFRSAIKEGSGLGQKVKEYLDKGELVPDELTIALVKERLAAPDAEKGFLLDGFPRTVKQAEALDELLSEMGRKLNLVLNLEVAEEKLLARLTGRRVCRNCGATYHLLFNPPAQDHKCDVCGSELYQREDDKEETVRKRLEVYHASTEPLIGYYKNKGLLKGIDGNKEINEVLEDILRIARRI